MLGNFSCFCRLLTFFKINLINLKLAEQAMKILERIVDGLIRQVVSIDDSQFGFVPEEALQMQSLWSGSCRRNT